MSKKIEEIDEIIEKDTELRNNLSDVSNDLEKIKCKISEYNEKGGYNEENIKFLNENINILEEKRDNLNKMIGKSESDFKNYKENKKKLDTVISKLNVKENELNELNEYLKIIDPRNGYPNELIKSSLDIFNKRVNEFVNSANFNYVTIIKAPELIEDSKKQSQKLIFSHKKNNKLFSELSGAENFILNIATLSVLGTILNTTTPPLLVIDEGFSCLDKNHIEELPTLLNFVKTRFNYILYISHDEFIKSKGDYNIKVEKKEW